MGMVADLMQAKLGVEGGWWMEGGARLQVEMGRD